MRILLINLLTILICHVAHAFSCRTLTAEAGKEHLAFKQFGPPYGAMYLTSFVGNIFASAVVVPKDSNNKPEPIQPENSIAVLFNLAGLASMFSAQIDCSVGDELNINRDQITVSDLNQKKLSARRNHFLITHSIFSFPTLLYTLKSERTDKWSYFGGAVIAPALVDIFLRMTFYRDKVSPWTIQSNLIVDNKIIPGLIVSYNY